MQKKALAIIVIMLATLISLSHAEAAVNRYSLLRSRPTYDPSPFFTVRQSQNLKSLDFYFGTTLDYSYKPLRAAITGAPQQFDLVRTLIAEHFYGTIGITDWAEFSVSLPVIWYNRFVNPDTLGAPATHRDIGDLQIEPKFRILSGKVYPVGLAIAPFITVPTGDAQRFVGDVGVTGGARFIIDAVITDRYTLALNMGGLASKEFNAYGRNLGSQFLVGLGAAIKIAKGVTISGEVEASTPFANFFQNENTSPVDLRGGVKWDVGKTGLTLGASSGTSIPHGAGSPKIRVLGMLAYTFSARFEQKRPKVVRKKVNREPLENEIEKTIYFEINSHALTAESREKLDKVTHLLRKNTSIMILINGYCDSSGPGSFNEILSEKRAEAVYDCFKSAGVDPARMIYQGVGYMPPADPLSGQKLNRKVQIVIRPAS